MPRFLPTLLVALLLTTFARALFAQEPQQPAGGFMGRLEQAAQAVNTVRPFAAGAAMTGAGMIAGVPVPTRSAATAPTATPPATPPVPAEPTETTEPAPPPVPANTPR